MCFILCPAAGIQQDQPQARAAELSLEQRGDLFMAKKMFREAAEAYTKAIPGPRDYILYNKAGIAYHQMQNFPAAKKNYEKSLKLNAEYSEARNNLGTLYFAQKNYRGAIREYDRALKLNPKSGTYYGNLGTAYFARKDYALATKAYQQALALDPDVFEARGSVGTVIQERSVEERAKYHYYLAKIYAEAGTVDRALDCIRKSLEEGFKDRKKYLEEPAFSKLRDLPEFQALMKLEPRVL
jgi:tetratricopeptide (TPR) repeat protein